MRIGIDIDNVISNFNDELLKEYLEHDKKLRNTGIINENPHHITQGMFDWTKEENDDFYYNNIERIAKKLKPLSRAAEIISKLKNENNEIYIISSRDNGEYTNPKEMTEKWLSDNNIQYDVLILTYKGEKGKICKENNIDIMIDDSINNCKDVSEYGIKVLLMETRYNKHVTEFEKVSNWREIYKKIKESYPKKEQEKINVILDTDTFNECDDQFAVSYMIKSQERFNIEAITIAPYHHDNDISIEEGLEKSYQEVLKICKWLDFNTESKVFKGATDYLANGYNKTNEAVEKIIGIALKNEKTYIMAIGAITNVAMAIMKEPRIIDKIEVIWLGGHSILIKDNMEFNFRQDIKAVRTVFESKVKLTVIPCKNVASNLKTTIYEIEHHLKNKNEVGTYLCERFYNDGKHGIQTRRVIWDISVIAYLINKEWFEISQINCPNIKEDTSYELNTNNRLITMVDFIDSDKIYEDMFEKLGEKNEINE